ncbi:unnamed protein product [Schistosoma margrebowiei]|uniref:Uncharacterized protein n=1 Tax=Schistosoma margrebowiei TaxID=48269 RepID=A0A183L8N3_9TREM|nr:unnamed protein product [Schistosoma margrebowiei]
MWETGRSVRKATEMRRYNMAVFEINKTHWIQAGQKRLDGSEQQDLRKEETTMEDGWKKTKEALTSMYQKVLDSKQHHLNEWISIETLDRIKERKNKKSVINNSWTGAGKVRGTRTQDITIDARFQNPDSVRFGRAHSKLPHYESSLNVQLNGNRHYISTSFTNEEEFDGVDCKAGRKLL